MSDFTSLLAQQNPGGQSVLALAGGFVAPLADLAILAARGEDAATFLHNQLTNDVEHLAGSGSVRLAGYCTPKGRLLATMLLWQSEDAIWLQTAADLAPALQKRLQMFVLRSKVKLAAGERFALGLGGAQAAAALAPWFPTLPAQPYALLSNDHGTVLRVADAFGAPRFQWIAPELALLAAWPQLTATLHAAGPEAWRLSEIH
ncbi:MAG TPA: folate-binding protein, partial [Burkholderiaceae bacterium]